MAVHETTTRTWWFWTAIGGDALKIFGLVLLAWVTRIRHRARARETAPFASRPPGARSRRSTPACGSRRLQWSEGAPSDERGFIGICTLSTRAGDGDLTALGGDGAAACGVGVGLATGALDEVAHATSVAKSAVAHRAKRVFGAFIVGPRWILPSVSSVERGEGGGG